MDVLELAERVECGTLEILRELEDMVPRFAPKELKAMQEQAKAHLKILRKASASCLKCSRRLCKAKAKENPSLFYVRSLSSR